METNINRKEFIRYSGLALAAISLSYKIPFTAAKAGKLSFSTLGCPKWDLPAIINFASAHGYQGVEIRGIAGEMDLTKCAAFSAGNIESTKRMISDKGLTVTDLGSSAQLNLTNETELQKSLDEAKKFIELANRLDCKYVRVFPDKLLTGRERKKSLDTIVANLSLLGNFARESHVTVLIESHGDLVDADELLYVIQHSENSNAGLVWDIHNMWSVTKQTPAEVFKKLGKYIMHVHVKDAKMIDGKEQYVLLGKGDVPVREAVKLLEHSGYNGFYSLEWEKLWHPELEEPEVALTLYPEEIKKYF